MLQFRRPERSSPTRAMVEVQRCAQTECGLILVDEERVRTTVVLQAVGKGDTVRSPGSTPRNARCQPRWYGYWTDRSRVRLTGHTFSASPAGVDRSVFFRPGRQQGKRGRTEGGTAGNRRLVVERSETQVVNRELRDCMAAYVRGLDAVIQTIHALFGDELDRELDSGRPYPELSQQAQRLADAVGSRQARRVSPVRHSDSRSRGNARPNLGRRTAA
jgi:hypothetical protein